MICQLEEKEIDPELCKGCNFDLKDDNGKCMFASDGMVKIDSLNPPDEVQTC